MKLTDYITDYQDHEIKNFLQENLIKTYDCFDQQYTQSTIEMTANLLTEGIKLKYKKLNVGALVNFFQRVQFGDIQLKKISVSNILQMIKQEYQNEIIRTINEKEKEQAKTLNYAISEDNYAVFSAMSWKLDNVSMADYDNFKLTDIQAAMMHFNDKKITFTQLQNYVNNKKNYSA